MHLPISLTTYLCRSLLINWRNIIWFVKVKTHFLHFSEKYDISLNLCWWYATLCYTIPYFIGLSNTLFMLNMTFVFPSNSFISTLFINLSIHRSLSHTQTFSILPPLFLRYSLSLSHLITLSPLSITLSLPLYSISLYLSLSLSVSILPPIFEVLRLSVCPTLSCFPSSSC